MMKRRHFLGLTAAAGLCLSAPVRAAGGGITITDAIGRQVTVPRPVQRVALNFNYEEFTAIAGTEGWQKIVGISRAPWEGWRPVIFKRYGAVIPNLAAMPDIGHSDDGTFSAEKVISLKPDVLIMAEWAFKAQTTACDQIQAAGIPILVIDYNAQLLERHIASTLAIGAVMGTEDRAQDLVKLYEAQYNDILARVARTQGPKPKVYIELGYGADIIGNTYSGTMWGKILALLGAENIAVGKISGSWAPLSAEAVLASDPDHIFLAGSSWTNRPKSVRTGYDISAETTRDSLKQYLVRPGWSDLKAIRSGHLHAIEHGLCRTLFDYVAMQYIAKQLYPQAFTDVDPVASFRDYHARFLPVSFSGTWMMAANA